MSKARKFVVDFIVAMAPLPGMYATLWVVGLVRESHGRWFAIGWVVAFFAGMTTAIVATNVSDRLRDGE